MPFAPMLALAALVGATLLTYLYDRDALLWSRLCAGVCTGVAALGLIGFVLVSLLGMTPTALALAGAFACAPILLLRGRELRGRVLADFRESLSFMRQAVARPERGPWGVIAFYVVAAVLLSYVCDRAMYENVSGVFTGMDTNIGDLPFHLAVITGFAHGENFPPQHPEYAGVPMTYPFVMDFVTAMLVRAGASLRGAFFWQNYALMLALTGLLHRLALRLTRDRVAALLTPVLIFLSGGFGWLKFLKEAAQGGGAFNLLGSLKHDYTIMEGYRWGNVVTALFVPQRGILLGVALAILVWTLWALASEKAEGGGEVAIADLPSSLRHDSFAFCLSPFSFRPMIAAGLVAGLLPLVHAHTFVVTMAMGGCLALLQAGFAFAAAARARRDGPGETDTWVGVKAVALPWLAFAVAALIVGAPQMLWATSGSAVQAGNFFGWELGWDHGTENVAWFWIKNTGLFIPLLVAALAWRGRLVPARLLYFYLPFTLCFVLPNLFRLSPWVWDNIKILIYWWIASAPLVALVLARLWRAGPALRVLAVVLLIAQTGAGGLDVWRAASGAVERQTFDRNGVKFAELIKRETPPRSLILHAPTYNDPVYLTGRRSFLGYAGHLWSHGLDFTARGEELNRIYAGGPEAADLLAKNRIEYVVVGPLEEAALKERGLKLDKTFFERYTKVGEEGEYRLYKTAQP
ncbi:MAG: hypothetical protein H7Z38_04085 [Rubrivivax sp.]|nr:hypothetical protein [Pyrinomonadaceae bacterium]